MKQFFPVFELIDRYTIAQVKFERTNANAEELFFYQEAVADFDLKLIKDEFTQLKNIHNQIWNLEAQLKSGREHELPLEEIGRRAIEIRDWNNKRIQLKNTIADKLGQGSIKEIKKDHLSE